MTKEASTFAAGKRLVLIASQTGIKLLYFFRSCARHNSG